MSKKLEVVEAQGKQNPEPEKVLELPDNASVKVRNQGKPFPCDLREWGYGMRWPTGAVYTIPVKIYMELLKQGLDGVSA